MKKEELNSIVLNNIQICLYVVIYVNAEMYHILLFVTLSKPMCYFTVIMCYLNLRVNICDLIWFDLSLLYFVLISQSNGKMGTANRVHYRGGALQGHDHCTLFVTCCRHPVYSSRTFPSTFLLFVWRQKLLICYHHFPVLARYTYLLLKDLVRYILNGDYLSRTLTGLQNVWNVPIK